MSRPLINCVVACVVAPLLALSLAVPATAWAGPPEAGDASEDPAEGEGELADADEPPSSGAAQAADGSHPGGAYGEPVDYDWDGSRAPPPPDTGPKVEIEVHNSLRPVYLLRGSESGDEVCEAPCGRRIGDPSGQFVLAGPGRRTSKPFSLQGGDSLRLVATGGNPKRKTLGIVVIALSVAAAAGLAITPTRLNMPKGAGIGMWAAAGAIGGIGLVSGVVLIRFSRTQVKVLSGG